LGEWEYGGLKILEKSGDLSNPNNYRATMKVIANVLKVRLVTISETLPHEMQNGFRRGRGCSDGTRNVRFVLRKLKRSTASRTRSCFWTSSRLSTAYRASCCGH
jgi:hypothetical protein